MVGLKPSFPILSEHKRKIFLSVLARTGRPVMAARAVGLKTTTMFYRYAKENPEFQKQWDEALNAAGDVLEEAAVKRAVSGITRNIYHKGVVVGQEIVYSDQLLMFVLKGARPKKFRDSSVHVDGHITGKIGVALMPATAPSLESWERAALEVHDMQRLKTIEADYEDVTDKVQKSVARG